MPTDLRDGFSSRERPVLRARLVNLNPLLGIIVGRQFANYWS
jgi:hypothetical protein